MNGDRDAAEVLALLDDEYARDILKTTSGEALSASEVSGACGMSVSTVYRRADRLVDCGLLVEPTVATPDGNHYNTYEASIGCLTISVPTESVDVSVTERPSAIWATDCPICGRGSDGRRHRVAVARRDVTDRAGTRAVRRRSY